MVSRDPEFDTSDPEHDEFRRKLDEDRALKRASYFEHVLSSTAGRAVLWDIIAAAGVFAPCFSSDALVMAFNEGKREFGRELLLRLTEQFPEAYAKMQAEAQAEAVERRVEENRFLGRNQSR